MKVKHVKVARYFLFILVLMFCIGITSTCFAAPPVVVGPNVERYFFKYKQIGGKYLGLNVFRPTSLDHAHRLPAVVFFHGGAWTGGTPEQFSWQAIWLAKTKKVIGITVDYRIATRDFSNPYDSLEDSVSALCWIYGHASELGIDPNRIAAAGGSAGGHLALASYMFFSSYGKSCDAGSKARPKALILFNPVVDATGRWEKMFKIGLGGISPLQNLTAALPPTVIFQGTEDSIFGSVQQFAESAKLRGSLYVDLVQFPGRQHGFFNSDTLGDRLETIRLSLKFLQEIKWIDAN